MALLVVFDGGAVNVHLNQRNFPRKESVLSGHLEFPSHWALTNAVVTMSNNDDGSEMAYIVGLESIPYLQDCGD